MIIRLGLNSYLLRFFHLVAHAFFKALLFISTGNIIHINNDYQDLRTTGRKEFSSLVRRKFVLIANFRLIGLPFIARFFSKENIIELIILFNNYFYVYILILLRVLRTAIYRTRFISYYFIRIYNKFIITWNKDEDFLIILRILLLLIPAALGGWWLNDLLINFQIVSRNSSLMLRLILLILVIGIWAGFRIRSQRSRYKYSIFMYSMVGIWNLALISTKNFVYLLLVRKIKTTAREIGFITYRQTKFFPIKFSLLKIFNEVRSLLLYLLIISLLWFVLLILIYYFNKLILKLVILIKNSLWLN